MDLLASENDQVEQRAIQIRNGQQAATIGDEIVFDADNQSVMDLQLTTLDQFDLDGNPIAGLALSPLHVRIQLRIILVKQFLAEEGSDQGCIIEFKGISIAQEIKEFIQLHQTVIPSESMTRDILLNIKIHNQIGTINLEAPRQDPLVFYASDIDSTTVTISVEEVIYKLEKDEEAMLQRIKDTNLKATGVDGFLFSRMGGIADLQNEGTISLAGIIDKKKVFVSSKVIIAIQPIILQNLFGENTPMAAADQQFLIQLDTRTSIKGNYRVCSSDFTRMPKGNLSIKIEDSSEFMCELESNTPEQPLTSKCSGIIIRVSKIVDNEGEQLTYRITEQDRQQTMQFDTCFFDDYLKIQVYQNRSTAKANLIGKATVYLRDLAFNTPMFKTGETPIYPITINNRRGQFQAGTLFLNVQYKQLSKMLLCSDWANNLLEASCLKNKFEFFNENLANEFKDDCQFGQLCVELTSLQIPYMSMNYKKQDAVTGQLNQIFMLKIKIATESTSIFIGAPNRILDIQHAKMFANIDSINDKVYIEFYDVIKEDGFDPRKASNDTSNLKLLSLRIFDVRDFPFQKNGKTNGFRILMPVEHSGNVASFTFNADFTRSVPAEDVEKPIAENKLYLLFFRMIQTAKQTMHHSKDLDMSHLVAEVKNLSRPSQASRRLFFNKEIFLIGSLKVKLNDQVKISFLIKKPDQDELEPFTTSMYVVSQQGLKQTVGGSAFIELSTWRAKEMIVPFNFTSETQFLTKYKQKEGKNTLGKSLLSEKTILKDVVIEVEPRHSDFIEISDKKQLESCTIKVYIDKSSIIESLLAQDLSQEAQIKVQLVSDDRRSVRERKSYLLNDFDFDHAITLRLFTENDIVQILFIDQDQEHFVTLKCADLPLNKTQRIAWYVQVNTKQIRLEVQLDQDISLLPEEVEIKNQAVTRIQGMFQNLGAGVQQRVTVQKDTMEFQQSLKELEGKGDAEKILLLKSLINKQGLKNKKLITKSLRMKRDTEKLLKGIEEAKVMKEAPTKPVAHKDPDLISEFKSYISGTAFKSIQKQSLPISGKAKEKELSICACGNLNPMHNGYCTTCVQNLKAKYDELLDQLAQVNELHANFNDKEVDKAEDKLKLMRAKAEQYEIKLSDAQMMDVFARYEKISDSEENRQLAERRVGVQAMQQEQQIILFKQQIEVDDFEKQKGWLETRIQVKQIEKKDQERETQNFMYEFDKCNDELEKIELRTKLKKRYVVQQQTLTKAREQKQSKEKLQFKK